MHRIVSFLLIVTAANEIAASITCYRGLNVPMPGANFNQTMGSIGCNNAQYCLRSFGTMNGQAGAWISSCVSDKNNTCKDYPHCVRTQANLDNKNLASDYTTCCCKTNLCNHLDFTGDFVQSTTGSRSSVVGLWMLITVSLRLIL